MNDPAKPRDRASGPRVIHEDAPGDARPVATAVAPAVFATEETERVVPRERSVAAPSRGGPAKPRPRGRRRRRLDWRRTTLPGRLEGRGSHGDDLLGVVRLHGLNGVAGIDRPLERVGRHDLDDVGDLHHVEQRGDARHDVLAGRGCGRDDGVVSAGERHDQRCHRFRQLMLVRRRIGHKHLGDTVELAG
jgi:hypothetical protein